MRALDIAVLIFFMPSEGFRQIKKDRSNFSYAGPVTIIILLIAARLFNIFVSHFPLAGTLPEHARFSQEVMTIIVPIVIFIISCYLVTTILSGESLFREVFAAVAYSLLPIAVLTFPLTLLSRIMSSSGAGVYNTMFGILFAWSAVLLLVSISVMNSYSFRTTIGVAFLTIFAGAFMIVVISLVYALGARVIDFIREVISEYKLIISEWSRR